jgi:hypothetical protein
MSALIYPQALVLGATQHRLVEAADQEPAIGVARVDTFQGSIVQKGWMYPGDVEHLSIGLRGTLAELGIPFVVFFTKPIAGPDPFVLRACWSTSGAAPGTPVAETWCDGEEARARGWMAGSPYGVEPTAHQRLQALATPSGVVPRPMP